MKEKKEKITFKERVRLYREKKDKKTLFACRCLQGVLIMLLVYVFMFGSILIYTTCRKYRKQQAINDSVSLCEYYSNSDVCETIDKNIGLFNKVYQKKDVIGDYWLLAFCDYVNNCRDERVEYLAQNKPFEDAYSYSQQYGAIARIVLQNKYLSQYESRQYMYRLVDNDYNVENHLYRFDMIYYFETGKSTQFFSSQPDLTSYLESWQDEIAEYHFNNVRIKYQMYLVNEGLMFSRAEISEQEWFMAQVSIKAKSMNEISPIYEATDLIFNRGSIDLALRNSSNNIKISSVDDSYNLQGVWCYIKFTWNAEDLDNETKISFRDFILNTWTIGQTNVDLFVSSNRIPIYATYLSLTDNFSQQMQIAYNNGTEYGKSLGYSKGYDDAMKLYEERTSEGVAPLIAVCSSIMSYGMTFLKEAFDVNFLGINLASMFVGFISVLVFMWIIKKVL